MKLTLNEWIGMQRNPVRVCEGPETTIPKVIFIGILMEDGSVETRMKLVSVSEWRAVQEAWEGVCGANYLDKDKSLRQASQFFLICR